MRNTSGFKKGVGKATVCPLLAIDPLQQVASKMHKTSGKGVYMFV